jgi:coenzyme F420-reducing hydrogenase beta subunit
MKQKIVLFDSAKDCCGCGACFAACPHNAIEMRADPCGFRYPVILEDRCVGCGLCLKTCGFTKDEALPLPSAAYAVQAKDGAILEKSSSGGVFAALAKMTLEQGGAVVGCALERIDGKLTAHHSVIESPEALSELQGSKYLQSDTAHIYNKVRNLLNSQRKVLFSGTPCQVDGLKHFLGNKEYPHLMTVDLICHGVPSPQMFSDYIGMMERRCKGTVLQYRFRDKSAEWGYQSRIRIQYENSSGEKKETVISSESDSYYKLFQRSEISRESCYRCKYADLHRPGDLTLGDYWGIEGQHPEALAENGGTLSPGQGISCVLVNTQRGSEMLDAIMKEMNVTPSDARSIAKENAHLRQPPVEGVNRQKILRLYTQKGYGAVDSWFAGYNFRRKIKRRIGALIRKIRH